MWRQLGYSYSDRPPNVATPEQQAKSEKYPYVES